MPIEIAYLIIAAGRRARMNQNLAPATFTTFINNIKRIHLKEGDSKIMDEQKNISSRLQRGYAKLSAYQPRKKVALRLHHILAINKIHEGWQEA